MNWFDQQIAINTAASINFGLVFFFVRKSSNAKLHVVKATHGVVHLVSQHDVLDRYQDVSKIYEQYEFVAWAVGSMFPILTLNGQHK
jgi:hypothetical protein